MCSVCLTPRRFEHLCGRLCLLEAFLDVQRLAVRQPLHLLDVLKLTLLGIRAVFASHDPMCCLALRNTTPCPHGQRYSGGGVAMQNWRRSNASRLSSPYTSRCLDNPNSTAFWSHRPHFSCAFPLIWPHDAYIMDRILMIRSESRVYCSLSSVVIKPNIKDFNVLSHK